MEGGSQAQDHIKSDKVKCLKYFCNWLKLKPFAIFFNTASLEQTTVDVDRVTNNKEFSNVQHVTAQLRGSQHKRDALSAFLHLPEVDVSFSLMYVCTTSCKKNKSPTSTVTQSPSSKVEFRLVSTTCGLAGVTGSSVMEDALVTKNNMKSITT